MLIGKNFFKKKKNNKNMQMSVWTIVIVVTRVPVSISWLQVSQRSSASVTLDGLEKAATEVGIIMLQIHVIIDHHFHVTIM